MRKWMKVTGIVTALAAVSVMSFAAVSYAQVESQGEAPSLIERFRGPRGGEMDGQKDAALAEALGMTVEELQAAKESGQTIEEIAEAQGVDLEAVKESLAADRLAALEASLAEKVAAGDITQEQADEMLQRVQDSDFAGRSRGGVRGARNGGHVSVENASPEAQAAVAGVLNMTVEELQAAVESGQSLSEIADAQGVEMEAVQAVISEYRLAALETSLAERVAAGDITQEQADAILEQAQSGDFPGRGGNLNGDLDGVREGRPDGRRGGNRGGAPQDVAPDGSIPGGTNFQAPETFQPNL